MHNNDILIFPVAYGNDNYGEIPVIVVHGIEMSPAVAATCL